jgi:hypothetical protein
LALHKGWRQKERVHPEEHRVRRATHNQSSAHLGERTDTADIGSRQLLARERIEDVEFAHVRKRGRRDNGTNRFPSYSNLQFPNFGQLRSPRVPDACGAVRELDDMPGWIPEVNVATFGRNECYAKPPLPDVLNVQALSFLISNT